MGQLIVRGLDDRLIQALKRRAARSGRPAEAEHRAILEHALQPETETFAEAAARLRARTSAPDAEERMTVLLRAPVTGTPIAGLMLRAFAISAARMVTIYDSLYLALAEKRDIPMVTADECLIRQLSGDAGLAKRMIRVADLAA